MDSIAGAIGASELYSGFPSRSSELNSETKFCLNYWGVPIPAPVEDLLSKYPTAGVCLVDHQQTSQLNKSIDVSAHTITVHYNMTVKELIFNSTFYLFSFEGGTHRGCHRPPCSAELHNRH